MGWIFLRTKALVLFQGNKKKCSAVKQANTEALTKYTKLLLKLDGASI